MKINTLKKADLYSRISEIIQNARKNIGCTVDYEMVNAYWLIGKEIIEEEQKGRKRAEYGSNLMKSVSERLSNSYGAGFSE